MTHVDDLSDRELMKELYYQISLLNVKFDIMLNHGKEKAKDIGEYCDDYHILDTLDDQKEILKKQIEEIFSK